MPYFIIDALTSFCCVCLLRCAAMSWATAVSSEATECWNGGIAATVSASCHCHCFTDVCSGCSRDVFCVLYR